MVENKVAFFSGSLCIVHLLVFTCALPLLLNVVSGLIWCSRKAVIIYVCLGQHIFMIQILNLCAGSVFLLRFIAFCKVDDKYIVA